MRDNACSRKYNVPTILYIAKSSVPVRIHKALQQRNYAILKDFLEEMGFTLKVDAEPEGKNIAPKEIELAKADQTLSSYQTLLTAPLSATIQYIVLKASDICLAYDAYTQVVTSPVRLIPICYCIESLVKGNSKTKI